SCRWRGWRPRCRRRTGSDHGRWGSSMLLLFGRRVCGRPAAVTHRVTTTPDHPATKGDLPLRVMRPAGPARSPGVVVFEVAGGRALEEFTARREAGPVPGAVPRPLD